MSHVLYYPDRAICRALRRIDPSLSVEWVEPGRWAVFHNLPHPGNVDRSAFAMARILYYDFRANGYEKPMRECLRESHAKIMQENLIHVVKEPDGSYRPLDGRVVTHLRRLDWQRRNWFVSDYLRVARAQAADLEGGRRKDIDAVWDDLRRENLGYVDTHHHSFSHSALQRISATEAP